MQTLPPHAAQAEADGPGEYVVVHDNAAVRATIELSSPEVGRLAAGQHITVLEVVHRQQDNRVRARIAPSGWISLSDLVHGYRWARKVAAAAAPPKPPPQWAVASPGRGTETMYDKAFVAAGVQTQWLMSPGRGTELTYDKVGLSPRDDEMEADDSPGEYIVTHANAAVRSSVELASPVVGRLSQGQQITVAEIVRRAQDNRVRARIVHPAGWISLFDPAHGYRWARKAAPGEAERLQLVRQIEERDAQLAELRGRVEQLRAQRQACLHEFQERAAELEARLFASHLVPVTAQPRRLRERDYLAGHLGHEVAEAEDAAAATWRDYYTRGVPPGGRVVDVRRVELNPWEAQRLAYVPPEPTKPKVEVDDEELWLKGRHIISNALFLPSCNHAGPRPKGIFPVTRPPAGVMHESFLDRTHEYFQPADAYSQKDPGVWRFGDAGGCPLAVAEVHMVRDAYGGSLAPSPVYRQVYANA